MAQRLSPDPTVLVDQVHDAVVGEAGDDRSGDGGERAVQVERVGEQAARLPGLEHPAKRRTYPAAELAGHLLDVTSLDLLGARPMMAAKAGLIWT